MARHRDEIVAALTRVIDSGRYILGGEVEAFEKEFAAATGCSHGVGVGSGTDAVEIALRACGVNPGDAVFTVSHTAVATVTAIVATGAVPVLVDIDPDTYTMSPASLAAAIAQHRRDEPRVRAAAAVVVHLYGRPAAITDVLDICRQFELRVVEDCAQAHGAAIDGRRAGSFGDAAAFSFYPTKNLGGIGDGGIVVTNDPGIADNCRLERQYGWKQRYVSERVGTNSRLDEIQAAVLRVLLPRLDAANDHRIAVARAYDGALDATSVVPPRQAPKGFRHVYHQYVIESDDRDGLAAHLADDGIGTAVLYPRAVHQQAAFERHARLPVDLSSTERACRRILSLPIGLHVTADDVDRVAGAVRSHERRA